MQHIIHWFDRYLLWLVSKPQVLFVFNDYLGSAEQTGQTMLKKEIHSAYNYLYIHSIWVLYTNCIHNVYDVQFLYIRTDVYKMYTKCIPHFNKLLCTFSIQNVYKIYTKCLYTKCPPYFNKLLCTKCIKNVFISNISHILTKFCINFVYKI